MTERDTIIQDIYEAVALPDRWPALLERIGRTVDTPGVLLLTHRNDAWSGHTVSKPMEHDFLQYMATDIVSRSQTTTRLIGKDWAGFLSSLDLFSAEEWERDPFRNEWGRKWGWNHAAATAIRVPSGDSLVFHLQRRDDQGPFNARSIAVLDSLRPHLARAGLLAARWRLQRLNAATQALGLVGLPAAILDRTSKVLSANSLMDDLKQHVRWLPRGRLALADKNADQLLQNAMDSLEAGKTPAVQSFPAGADGDSVVVHLVPAYGQTRDLFDGGLSLLLVTPVSVSDAPSLDLIRGLFDLSPGEARVARGLTAGESIQQIADKAGVSITTVKSQLKGVFAKTGKTRQAAVVALLAGLWRPRPNG